MTEQNTAVEIREQFERIMHHAKTREYLHIMTALHFIEYTDDDEDVTAGDHSISVNFYYEPRKAIAFSIYLWQVDKAECKQVYKDLLKELRSIHTKVDERVIVVK